MMVEGLGGKGGGVEVEMAKLDLENELLVRVCAGAYVE